MTPATLAARDSAAVFLLEGRTHIEITGADRAAFLHNFCTNDIKSLAPGQGCEAFLCNAKGRVVGHVTVFIGADSIWLETVPEAGPTLMAHLDRYIIREEVQLHDRSQDLAELAIIGPNKPSFSRNFGEDPAYEPTDVLLSSLPELSTTPQSQNGFWYRNVDWFKDPEHAQIVTLQRPHKEIHVDWFQRPIRLVLSTESATKELLRALVAARATAGNEADWESLRIDAGFPTYGVDLTDDNLPQEAARSAKCISFTKGCYLGQEPVARLDALGHTNRELRRLICTTNEIPSRGAELLEPASSQVAGHITSAAPNPFGEGVVALAMLKSKWLAAGTRLLCSGIELTVR